MLKFLQWRMRGVGLFRGNAHCICIEIPPDWQRIIGGGDDPGVGPYLGEMIGNYTVNGICSIVVTAARMSYV